jgi:hypothetical protein
MLVPIFDRHGTGQEPCERGIVRGKPRARQAAGAGSGRSGGLIEVDGTRKLSFERLEGLLEQWGRLSEKRERDVTGGPR